MQFIHALLNEPVYNSRTFNPLDEKELSNET